MANCVSDADRNEVYYLRHSLLVKEQGWIVLKAIFDNKIPPNKLHAELQNATSTLNDCKKKSYITKPQWQLLYPPYGPSSSNNFDVTLLVCLLRNICGLKKKNSAWNINENINIPKLDISIEADIARLRNIRNEVDHRPKPCYQPEEFTEKWKETKEVLVRLSKGLNLPSLEQDIDHQETKPLDHSAIRSLRANTDVFLTEYGDENFFVKTKQYENSKTLLENKYFVVLTGHPGEGKTTLAARLALDISEKRYCFKLADPSDWRALDISLKIIDTIIIDDIFGAGSIDQRLVGDWKIYLPEIERAAKKKKIHVIITSRHYIYEESREELNNLLMFGENSECVILLSSTDLLKEEKKEILEKQALKYNKEIAITLVNQCIDESANYYEISNSDHKEFLFGFPECASMFIRNSNLFQEGSSFFQKPLLFFKTCLESMYKKKQRQKFIALVLVWAKECKHLGEDELRNAHYLSDHVRKVLEVFGEKPDNDFIEDIKAALKSHIGGFLIFITKTGEYKFSHNIVNDMVGLVIGKNKLLEVLELCPRDFFMEYVMLEENKENSQPLQFKIILRDRHRKDLVEKCVNMILRKNCNQVISTTHDDFSMLQRIGTRSNEINVGHEIDFGIIQHKAFLNEEFVKMFLDHVVNKGLVEKVFAVPVMTMSGFFLDYGISVQKLVMCLASYSMYSGASVFAKHVLERKILGESSLDPSLSLLLAVHGKSQELITFLLQHGAKVTGDTIYIAAHLKSTEILNQLLSQPGINVNDRGNAINGNYPLIVAARKGYLEAVKCLLAHNADPSVKNKNNMTALHKAIIYDHYYVIKTLVEKHAPLDVKGGKFQRTPLHIAADLGNTELVTYLLNNRASVTVKDHRGHFPIHIAAICDHVDIVVALMQHDKSQEKLRIKSYGKKSQIKGMSLYHIAIWKNNSKLLKALIANNVDPDIADFYGQTPLFYAIMLQREKMAKKLINIANKQKPQKQGYTPLHAAIHKGLTNIAKLLVPHVNVNARDKFGKAPIHVACEKCDIEMVAMLLRFNADYRAITKRGDTVYHILRRKQRGLDKCRQCDRYHIEQLLIEFDQSFAEKLPDLRNKLGMVVHVSNIPACRNERVLDNLDVILQQRENCDTDNLNEDTDDDYGDDNYTDDDIDYDDENDIFNMPDEDLFTDLTDDGLFYDD